MISLVAGTSIPTLSDALREIAQALTSASPSPTIDAEVLVMHACGVTRHLLYSHPERQLDGSQWSHLQTLAMRRSRGEPIAYITGAREFWSLALHVTPAVLIPRADTELLVERALERIPSDAEYTIADLGTGSGAVGLALAHERPRCRVLATDCSADALSVARENAHRLGIGNIEFHQGQWFEALSGKKVDIVVSNPPYIRSDDPHLKEGDLRYEPQIALIAGTDGLDAIRLIATRVSTHLARQGWLIIEHGYDQQQEVADIFNVAGFDEVRCYRDLASQPRIAEGCLKSSRRRNMLMVI